MACTTAFALSGGTFAPTRASYKVMPNALNVLLQTKKERWLQRERIPCQNKKGLLSSRTEGPCFMLLTSMPGAEHSAAQRQLTYRSA
jgi:hypothetical protein